MTDRTDISAIDSAQHAAAEVTRLHDFIAAWFRGEVPVDAFEPEFADVLHPQFQNVQPSGDILSKSELLEPIRAAHGANPDFRITIESPELVTANPGQIVMRYVEFQQGARNSTAENRRRSTVLFETQAGELIWRYLQETGML